MNFKFAHNNINVLDLKKSLEFYDKALGLKEDGNRIETDAFTIVYLMDGESTHRLELTYIHDRKEPYNLGDNEIHLAFTVDNYEAALAKHREMGCVVYENNDMGIYFIADPDGYWLEVIPAK